MIKQKNTIAACVVTYNRKNKLKKCIQALLDQSYKQFEIIIIDNASTDGTKDLLHQYIINKKIKYYNTGENLGGAGGFNFAIKQAANDYTYLWIMDDDTYPKSSALEEMVSHIDIINNQFGFFSSLTEWTDGNACLMNMQKIIGNPFEKITYLEKGLIPIETASFVSLFIKSDLVKKVGLPIKEFFLWGDDTEYTQRLSSYGGYIVISSVVIHDMDNNDGVDIINNSINRIGRYSLWIRNRIFIAKKSGKKNEIFKAYLSPIKQCILVLFKARDNKMERVKILLRGILSSIKFNPPIEFL